MSTDGRIGGSDTVRFLCAAQSALDPATGGAEPVLARWSLIAVTGFALSWLMYRAVELPAHHAARWLAARTPALWQISHISPPGPEPVALATWRKSC